MENLSDRSAEPRAQNLLPSPETIRFAAAQCKLTLGDFLESERQAMVYALVCLKPGENYNYYANHAWPRHSGKVYDELQALARKKLIWYAVAGAWKMSKPSGRKEFKEGRRFYPTHEFLARTVNPKRGAYTWLLDEYNETLREAIELGPGRTSPKEPCVIVWAGKRRT